MGQKKKETQEEFIERVKKYEQENPSENNLSDEESEAIFRSIIRKIVESSDVRKYDAPPDYQKS